MRRRYSGFVTKRSSGRKKSRTSDPKVERAELEQLTCQSHAFASQPRRVLLSEVELLGRLGDHFAERRLRVERSEDLEDVVRGFQHVLRSLDELDAGFDDLAAAVIGLELLGEPDCHRR